MLNGFLTTKYTKYTKVCTKLVNAFSSISWFQDGQITYSQILVAGAYIGAMLGAFGDGVGWRWPYWWPARH